MTLAGNVSSLGISFERSIGNTAGYFGRWPGLSSIFMK
jgi:hypothetical protein